MKTSLLFGLSLYTNTLPWFLPFHTAMVHRPTSGRNRHRLLITVGIVAALLGSSLFTQPSPCAYISAISSGPVALP
ncbi:hypothetical protein L2E82_12602 [Cichorium intybus]|uniref:Uncharacterized protein n=1 Tax=Cichorium intybus TaxID=13427 RepID=A0ACB9GHL0_CICIN|nr:hypothetical protein L2E82_12602 [Cichorium intybus]